MAVAAVTFDVACPHCGSRDEYPAPDPREHTCGHWSVLVPGVWPDLPEAAYHSDPVPGGSLSSTGARKLLPPSCPAKFAVWRAEPPDPTKTMELGTAAHRLALGTGQELVEVKAENWRTKAANEAADAARAAGAVPLLTKDLERVRAMRDALMAHPLASAALDPGRGRPEQSIFAHDADSGVWLRVRLDWMPDPDSPRRPVLMDYKTTVSAEPDQFARHAYDLGYHVQGAMYADVFEQVTGTEAALGFIVQEKVPPYLVSVCFPDEDMQATGRAAYRAAVRTYAECTAAGEWPGYPIDVSYISLPPWARRSYE
ncbi:MAG TPA: PD-(D/E)XK nuclease-like domain-containing protein [Trebonia sp.]|nr:PD-(D/E)XK nuclease-like domain-containing protein [Trebonia sp.]